MKVVICWAGISGYMLACWKALQTCQGVEVSVFSTETARQYDVDLALKYKLTVLEKTHEDVASLMELVYKENPDVVIICGWSVKGFYELPFQTEFKGIPFVLAMDTPWRGEFRQYLAKIKLNRFLKRMSGVFVSGERGSIYAKKLGFKPKQIFSGVYGCDFSEFSKALVARAESEKWPRKFLYVGRYAKEKGIDILLKAYNDYCERVDDPWTMSFYGAGELKEIIDADKRILEGGFIQPADLPAVFSEHGAFVMPSLYDPWGVVLAEAASAGMPLICTNEVCSSLDLVRHLFNGYVSPPNDCHELTQGLLWCHENENRLHVMSQYSQCYAKAYSAEMWAERWLRALRKVVSC